MHRLYSLLFLSAAPTTENHNQASVDGQQFGNVSFSDVFFPGAFALPFPQDVTIVTPDGVYFYAHSTAILAESSNEFAGLLSAAQLSAASSASGEYGVVPVSELSTVLNIVLHVIYGGSFAPYNTSTDDIVAAVDALHKYGVSVRKHLSVAHGSPLLSDITTQMRTSRSAPLHFYALAGKYDSYDLAARASAYLLAVKLNEVPLDLIDRMGPVYLKRLIALQQGRLDILRDLLAGPPSTHQITPSCSSEDQAALARAWQLVGAYFIWEMRPGTSAL